MSNPLEANPYQSPLYSSQPYAGTDAMSAGGVTPRTVEMLRQTQPWVRFISILLLIGAALMIVFGIGLVVFGLAGARRLGPFEMGMVAAYLVVGILYLMPAMYLSRYASHVGRLRNTLQVGELENALEAQKSFWKFAGIGAIVILVVYALIFAYAFLSIARPIAY